MEGGGGSSGIALFFYNSFLNDIFLKEFVWVLLNISHCYLNALFSYRQNENFLISLIFWVLEMLAFVTNLWCFIDH